MCAAHYRTCGRDARAARRAYTLLEILVALAILLAGILPIVLLLPQAFQTRRDAEYMTQAGLLAQLKAEEIRRDDDSTGTMTRRIAQLGAPTPPIAFAQTPGLSYSFYGKSFLYSSSESPQGDPNVARVIILKTPAATPATVNSKDVIYELRFGI
ncbi:MAG: prepilin-type N-terminal cleavage/methylation domain-containing protein [Candidatus Sumerlaeota bacterium]|nr:prepilin-type N-terminal cleavage/methylation domain-containing protein [Candidatus Sumerlaeota bacterium]